MRVPSYDDLTPQRGSVVGAPTTLFACLYEGGDDVAMPLGDVRVTPPAVAIAREFSPRIAVAGPRMVIAARPARRRAAAARARMGSASVRARRRYAALSRAAGAGMADRRARAVVVRARAAAGSALGGARARGSRGGGSPAGSAARGPLDARARAAAADRDAASPPAVTLRRSRPPAAIRVRADGGRPVHVASPSRGQPSGAVIDAAGPWRTSGSWWQRTRWNRDEWDVALPGGAICRIFR